MGTCVFAHLCLVAWFLCVFVYKNLKIFLIKYLSSSIEWDGHIVCDGYRKPGKQWKALVKISKINLNSSNNNVRIHLKWSNYLSSFLSHHEFKVEMKFEKKNWEKKQTNDYFFVVIVIIAAAATVDVIVVAVVVAAVVLVVWLYSWNLFSR